MSKKPELCVKCRNKTYQDLWLEWVNDKNTLVGGIVCQKCFQALKGKDGHKKNVIRPEVLEKHGIQEDQA